MMQRKTRRGFTLIEVLVVVLIIGVLAAIALPMYNRAVLRSRFNALMPIVKAMNDSNEAYYLEHGNYASNPQDLPVQGQSSYPTGTELEFGNNMDYAYVLASNSSARNNYIIYQKHSENYPGEIHCEAITGDDLAEYICESAGGTQNLGTTLTEGYTTYVIQGTGAGIAPGADDNADPMSCDKAIAMGFTCTSDETTGVKKICQNGICRIKTYNEDGSYTSITCRADSNGVCTANWYSVTYDTNGNTLATRTCSSVDNSGNCTAYSGGYYYTYDADGNKLSQRNCRTVDSSGSCRAYANSDNYNYTYDANGNKLTYQACSSVDSSGTCTAYNASSSYNYMYDANGNMLTERRCGRMDSSGTCTAYYASSSYDYTYDANGNRLTQRQCSSVNSSGNCTAYSGSGNYNYTYDANGNMLTYRSCSSMDSSGNCTAYNASNSYDYRYDTNGNQISQRSCSNVDSSGTCTAYASSANYDYTYDTNGNQLTKRTCDSMDSTGMCTAYSGAVYYAYDDNSKQVYSGTCYGNNINTSNGECTAYNSTTVSVY